MLDNSASSKPRLMQNHLLRAKNKPTRTDLTAVQGSGNCRLKLNKLRTRKTFACIEVPGRSGARHPR